MAQNGPASLEGHSYRETLIFSTNNGNAFVRGVDVWEDGLVWSVAGLGAPASGLLEDSTSAVILLSSAMPASHELSMAESQDLKAFLGTLGIASSRVWPEDLVCDDPASSCDDAVITAVAVGGYTCDNAAEHFVRGGEYEQIPTGNCGNAGNAWLWAVAWERRNILNKNIYVDGFWTNEPILKDQFVTFVATAGGGANQTNAYVRPRTVDSTYRFTKSCADNSGPTGNFRLASAGSFRGTAVFRGNGTFPAEAGLPQISHTSSGLEDAYVAVHKFDARLVTHLQGVDDPPVLKLGSSGPDGIKGVSINARTQEIVVCGYFGAGDLDFDPGTPTKFLPHAGGRDFFVASYNYAKDPTTLAVKWSLNWAYAWPGNTSGNEQAEGVWSDVTGATFVTGWKDEAAGGDLVVLRVDPPSCVVPCHSPALVWSQTVPGTGKVRGLDLAVDGIGRPIVTGEFTGAATFPANYNGYTSITIASQGGTDAFLARLDRDDGKAQWVANIGGEEEDRSTDVAVCQFNSARLVHGGDFRGTVDFDPSAGVALKTASHTDGFASVLEHQPEPSASGTPATYHISLLFDQLPDDLAISGSTTTDWQAQLQAFDAVLRSPAFVWQDGRASLQVVNYYVDGFGLRNPNDQFLTFDYTRSRESAMQVIPITTIRSNKEARWIADRLYWLDSDRPAAVPTETTETTWKTGTLNYAPSHVADYFDGGANKAIFKHPDHATYRHILAPIYRTLSTTALSDLLDLTVRQRLTKYNSPGSDPLIDQINAIAIDHGPTYTGHVTRAALLGAAGTGNNAFTESHRQQASPPVASEKHIAMAGASEFHATLNPNPWIGARMADLVTFMFMRMTVCPSDYDRNGVSSGTNPGPDWTPFITDYGPPVLSQYSDWNFDESQPSGGWQTNQIDGAKFQAGFGSQPGGCPDN